MVTMDTGSSELIVNSPDSNLCEHGRCTWGAYDPASSKTSEWVDDDMVAEYIVTAMNGSWFTDDVKFGGETIPQLLIGVGNKSTSEQNLWGFGYNPNKGAVPNSNTTLQTLYNADLIKSPSVSIYLNETGSEAGSMLMGGLDTSLYTGPLEVLPISLVNGEYSRVAVNLSSVSLDDGKSNTTSTTELPATVLLDTGNFDIKLPEKLAKEIHKQFDITMSLPAGGYNYSLCSCDLADDPAVFSFGFETLNVTVPMKSLVISPPDIVLEGYGVDPEDVPENVCVFAINYFPDEIAKGKLMNILGGAFLSNAYFVLDQGTQEVGLAQANFDPGESNVLEIGSDADSISDIASSTTSTSPSASSSSESGALMALAMPSLWTLAGTTVFGLLASL